ncbi:ribosomal protein L7/L12 [Catellatospora sp. NPDC049133]|jgi:ribosomal protein L7/L12|uniref:ribosomal protein L7/L12 n=1 Tax=Catellatospora sp. NPDC049133 TaxID=3155499 RepID=UPI0033F5A15D
MTEILLAAIVVLLVVIALLLARRSRHDSTDLLGSAMAARQAEHARASGTGSAGSGAPEAEFLVQQVRMLMNQRQKIPAVKLWRDATGVSLADAVKAVELIAAGGTPALPKSGLPTAAGQPADPLLGPELMTDARRLKRQGRAIEAIKLVRQHTGLGLREAKDVVDGL